jgi:hypothetical protein
VVPDTRPYCGGNQKRDDLLGRKYPTGGSQTDLLNVCSPPHSDMGAPDGLCNEGRKYEHW